MFECVALNHPKKILLFFVAQEVDDNIRLRLKQLTSDIALSRSWLLGAPKFIDQIDDGELAGSDLPVETVGGAYEMYSALSPNDLPPEIDQLHFNEVQHIVEFVKKLSLEENLEFEFELDNRYVGSIEDGKVDSTLSKGLLEEWRNQLARHKI